MSCEELQARLAEAEATIRAKDETIRQQAEKIAEMSMVAAAKDRKIVLLLLNRDLLEGYLDRALEAAAIPYAKLGTEERKRANDLKAAIEDRNDFMDTAERSVELIETAIKALAEAQAPQAAASDEGDKPYSYTVKTLTAHRADTLIDRMTRYGKKAMKSGDAKMLLQEVEGGSELDPKVIHRAMRYAATAAGGKLDKIGGVLRLIIPENSRDKTTVSAEPAAKRTVKLGGGFAGLILDGIADSVSSLRGGGTPGG
jgi:hypothetical protein